MKLLLKFILASIFFIAAPNNAVGEKSPLANASNIGDVRRALSNILSSKPFMGRGAGSYYETTPTTIDLPFFNASMLVSEVEFFGYPYATVVEFFERNDVAVLSVNFPNVVFVAYDFELTIYPRNNVPETINSYGNFIFPNVTASISFPESDVKNLTDAKVFCYQEGTPNFGIEDLVFKGSKNQMVMSTIFELVSHPEIFAREFLNTIGAKYFLRYLQTNLVRVVV